MKKLMNYMIKSSSFLNKNRMKMQSKFSIQSVCSKQFSFVKENEIVFNNIKDWWNPSGNMKMLHIFNDLRLNYISSTLKKLNLTLENKTCLDIGCGGGLLSESLRRKKANVLGIDPNKNSFEIAKNHIECYKGEEHDFMK